MSYTELHKLNSSTVIPLNYKQRPAPNVVSAAQTAGLLGQTKRQKREKLRGFL